jgi:hypothetical protein
VFVPSDDPDHAAVRSGMEAACSPISKLLLIGSAICRWFVKPTPGLEPGTPSLRMKCSTS